MRSDLVILDWKAVLYTLGTAVRNHLRQPLWRSRSTPHAPCPVRHAAPRCDWAFPDWVARFERRGKHRLRVDANGPMGATAACTLRSSPCINPASVQQGQVGETAIQKFRNFQVVLVSSLREFLYIGTNLNHLQISEFLYSVWSMHATSTRPRHRYTLRPCRL